MYAVLIVGQMVYVNRENAVAMPVGPEISVISCHAIQDVLNMASAKMEHVSVRRDGMDAIARYVSL